MFFIRAQVLWSPACCISGYQAASMRCPRVRARAQAQHSIASMRESCSPRPYAPATPTRPHGANQLEPSLTATTANDVST
eukprot:106236-Lingulodinium_polyedra.AAC.1